MLHKDFAMTMDSYNWFSAANTPLTYAVHTAALVRGVFVSVNCMVTPRTFPHILLGLLNEVRIFELRFIHSNSNSVWRHLLFDL